MSETPRTEPTSASREPVTLSTALLLLRVAAGAMMMVHGWAKASGYAEMSADFADPLGVGHGTSLTLAIFGELVCSALLIPGIATRLAAIPFTFTMIVAGVIVHAEDPWGRKELAVLYLVVGLVIAIAGPGRFSVDGQLAPRFPWGKYLVS